MRYLFGFLCGCALGVMPLVGCGETTGDGGSGGSAGTGGDGGAGGAAAIQSGTWFGGDPASNMDGEVFDTGWAICFNVNGAGTALTTEFDCDIDGRNENAFFFAEVSWKEDVSDCGTANRIGASMGHPTPDGILTEVPIVNNSFEIVLDEFSDVLCTISGTFDGDTARGTASCFGSAAVLGGTCALDGGWTANAPTGGGGTGGIGGMAGVGGSGGM